jgi:hypothetical protein
VGGDDRRSALTIFLIVLFWSLGALLLLRNAARLPVSAWSERGGVTRSRNWRQALISTAILLAAISVQFIPHWPVVPWLWIVAGLLIFLLVLVLWRHARENAAQRAQTRRPVPQSIMGPITRCRRILLGALLAPLANPFLLMMIGGAISNQPQWHNLRLLSMHLAASYAWGAVLCVLLLWGYGKSGMKWHLIAATIATLFTGAGAARHHPSPRAQRHLDLGERG